MDEYIWERTNSAKKLMFGSYPYPTNFYNQNIIEFIIILVKPGSPSTKPLEVKTNSKISQKEWVQFTKQIWRIPIPNKLDSAYGHHAALMPEEIARRLIKLYSFEGDIVLDPFFGFWYNGQSSQKFKKKLYRLWDIQNISTYNRWKTKLMDKNQIHNLDVISFLKKIPESSVDLIIADPPYNLNIAEWDRFKSLKSYLEFTNNWLELAISKLKDSGSIYIFNTVYKFYSYF